MQAVIKSKRNDKYNNKEYVYIPDFEVDGELYEIKGLQFFKNKNPNSEFVNPFNHSQDDRYKAKYRCIKEHNVKIITDCKKYASYVQNNYGKNFLNLFKAN